MKFKNNWTLNSADIPAVDMEHHIARMNYTGDLLFEYRVYTFLNQTAMKAVQSIKAVVEDCCPKEKLTFRTTNTSCIWLIGQKVFIDIRGLGDTMTETQDMTVHIYITADPELLVRIVEKFNSTFDPVQTYATVEWWYRDGGNYAATDVVVHPSSHELQNEFYPFIPGGFAKYLQDYLESESCILVLTGPPGTGKTSLLRHMIVHYKLKGMLTYDKELLEHDKLFVRFMISNKNRLLIIEDADSLLESREHYGNRCMDRFLNISDGLISGLRDKKIILSTNTADVRKIDPALVRPGRCFGVVQFRHLEFDEAIAAATVANLTIPNQPREYTLAEIFNAGAHKAKIRPMGLVDFSEHNQPAPAKPADPATWLEDDDELEESA